MGGPKSVSRGSPSGPPRLQSLVPVGALPIMLPPIGLYCNQSLATASAFVFLFASHNPVVQDRGKLDSPARAFVGVALLHAYLNLANIVIVGPLG